MSTGQKELRYRSAHADEHRHESLGEFQFEDKVIEALREGRKMLRPPKVEEAGVRAIYDTLTSTIWLESPETSAKEIEPTLEAEFRALADKWLRETGHLSDPVKKFMHRSYLKIIGMGEKVLPLILREVQKKSGHWFVALDAISPENPVKPEDETSLERVANAWVEWGKERDLI